MSHKLNPLLTQHLSSTIETVESLNERVRVRLREEKVAKKFSERDLAEWCQWSQSKIAQKLSGRTVMTLDELDALCTALKILPTEAVRDRGLEFCAEMTPTELRLLEVIRRLPKAVYDGLLALLQVQSRDVEGRGATPKRSLYGKPRPR